MTSLAANRTRRSLLVCAVCVLVAVALNSIAFVWRLIGVDAGWTLYSPYSTTTSLPFSYQLYQVLDWTASAAWCIGAMAAVRNLWLVNQRAQPVSPTTCRQCGYDSASLDAPACPECGSPHRQALGASDSDKSA